MSATPNPPTPPNKPTSNTPPSKTSRIDDEPRVVTRGRVSHVEFAVDQPQPMPVDMSPPKSKKPAG
jgi:hypothetical protein